LYKCSWIFVWFVCAELLLKCPTTNCLNYFTIHDFKMVMDDIWNFSTISFLIKILIIWNWQYKWVYVYITLCQRMCDFEMKTKWMFEHLIMFIHVCMCIYVNIYVYMSVCKITYLLFMYVLLACLKNKDFDKFIFHNWRSLSFLCVSLLWLYVIS
jgi:hypothetical protein